MTTALDELMTASTLTADLRSRSDWIRGEIVESNRIARPSDALLEYLLDRRTNLALVPQCYGGLHLDFLGEFSLIFEATRIDSTFGWIVFQLIGNPGRVLSFFSDSTVRNLLAQTDGRVVITYQNDASKARVTAGPTGTRVSGYWNFGTLADCATHFAVPFIDPEDGVERCMLLPPDTVERPDKWLSDAFKGASISPYAISNRPVNGGDPVAEIRLSNDAFRPYYVVPRSSIKHLAWSAGLAQANLDAVSGRDPSRASACWTEYEQTLCTQIQEVRARLQALGEATAAEDGPGGVPAAGAGAELNELHARCAPLQQLAVEGALQVFVETPGKALDSGSRVSRTLLDVLTLSLHGAIRPDISFIGRAISSSKGPN